MLRSQTLILFVHVLCAQLQVRLGSSTLANHSPKHIYPETGPRNIPHQHSSLRMRFLYISLATIFSAYSHAFCPLLNFTLGASAVMYYSDYPKPAKSSRNRWTQRDFWFWWLRRFTPPSGPCFKKIPQYAHSWIKTFGDMQRHAMQKHDKALNRNGNSNPASLVPANLLRNRAGRPVLKITDEFFRNCFHTISFLFPFPLSNLEQNPAFPPSNLF